MSRFVVDSDGALVNLDHVESLVLSVYGLGPVTRRVVVGYVPPPELEPPDEESLYRIVASVRRPSSDPRSEIRTLVRADGKDGILAAWDLIPRAQDGTDLGNAARVKDESNDPTRDQETR